MFKQAYRYLPAAFLLVLLCCTFYQSLSQCANHVTNVAGTSVVNGVSVTVTSSGFADVNSIYCRDTKPYLIGARSNISGTGSYTFNFNPPVSSIMLNISGVSLTPAQDTEMIVVYVNRQHYAIPAPGPPNNCDQFAALTTDGNIIGCNCSVSGWDSTVINGPITTLTVLDTLLLGTPGGSIFSLFICDGICQTVQLGEDTTLCHGDSILLNATLGGTPVYSWSTGEVTPSIKVDSTGSYSVTVTGISCTSIDTIHVTVRPAINVIAMTSRLTFCAGDTVSVCATSGFSSYQWNNGATTGCVNVQHTGNYYVYVTDSFGCTVQSNQLGITVNQAPPVSITVQGDTLRAFAGVTYQWYLNDIVLAGDTQDYFIVRSPGNYTVAITNSNGCNALSTAQEFTGIDNLDGGSLEIYPNPLATGMWKVTVDNNLIGGTLKIYDACGRLIHITKIEMQDTELDLRAAPGVYLLRVNTSEGTLQRRLVKL